MTLVARNDPVEGQVGTVECSPEGVVSDTVALAAIRRILSRPAAASERMTPGWPAAVELAVRRRPRPA